MKKFLAFICCVMLAVIMFCVLSACGKKEEIAVTDPAAEPSLSRQIEEAQPEQQSPQTAAPDPSEVQAEGTTTLLDSVKGGVGNLVNSALSGAADVVNEALAGAADKVNSALSKAADTVSGNMAN